MKLDYFDLISPDPIWLDGVGYIKCPTLREISRLKYKTNEYSQYLGILQINMDKYLDVAGNEYAKQLYESDKSVEIYDILILDEKLRGMLHNAFSFFICSDVYYVEKDKTFYITEKDENGELVIIGLINRLNYSDVCDCIMQMNFIKIENLEEEKFGSDKARKIAEKIKNFRLTKAKKNTSDKDMNLGNLISSLASRQNGLNIIDIWDMTIFQFYDQFHKQNYNNSIDIRSMNYAFMGGEFDLTEWFKNVRND